MAMDSGSIKATIQSYGNAQAPRKGWRDRTDFYPPARSTFSLAI
jgi:hypothetical protein